MRPDNQTWILIDGGDPESIRAAVVGHAGVCRHVVPVSYRAAVFDLSGGRFGVTFDPPATPYNVANLVGWLDDPKYNAGARRAVGWLSAPGGRDAVLPHARARERRRGHAPRRRGRRPAGVGVPAGLLRHPD